MSGRLLAGLALAGLALLMQAATRAAGGGHRNAWEWGAAWSLPFYVGAVLAGSSLLRSGR